ncbi:MAG: hypothetical protein EA385_15250 [Salinarimonadaceae bacterium]|nr:MAG: hypothetical protein EA385_15250 [Salinarimonadaceae bacterium]
MSADYAYWLAALQGERIDLNEATDETTGSTYPEPACGFYRHRRRDGEFDPVAVWRNGDGDLVAKIGGASTVPADSAFSERVFAYACKSPITEDVYRAVMGGADWPEDAPSKDEMRGRAEKRLADEFEPEDPKPSPARKNAPAHIIAEETIKELRAEAEKWLKSIGGKVTTQEQADRAANFGDRFAELEKEAVSTHRKEKEPHLEAGRAVDKAWKPVAALGDENKRWAKKLNTDFLIAEQKKAAAELAKKAAEGAPVKADDVKVKAGTRGRSVSLVTVTNFHCTDADALWDHYKNDPKKRVQMHPDVVKVVAKIATAELNAGLDVPGACLKTEKVAR